MVQGELARQRAEVVGCLTRRHSEALIILRHKRRTHPVGLFQRGHLHEPQLAAETIFKGAPAALDSAFGLRRKSSNLLHTEFFESAAELSRILLASQFFFSCPVLVVALEGAHVGRDISSAEYRVSAPCPVRRIDSRVCFPARSESVLPEPDWRHRAGSRSG